MEREPGNGRGSIVDERERIGIERERTVAEQREQTIGEWYRDGWYDEHSLAELETHAAQVKVLGSYPVAVP